MIHPIQMNRLLYISIAFLLCSCNGNKTATNEAQEARQDSIRNDDVRKADAVTDSLALIAWGDTRFGMTKQEVMASKAFSGNGKEKVNETGWDSYKMGYEKTFEFERQNGLRELMYIKANFKENELYEVTLESLERDASHLNDMIHDCYTIIGRFSERYNKPLNIKEGVTILDLDDNPNITVAHFVIGDKGITVNLQRNNSEYKYNVSIANFSFPKKKREPTKQEIEQQRKSDELRNDVRENSF